MRLLSMILLIFCNSLTICWLPTSSENEKIAAYNKNKAIEKLRKCNETVENCIHEMSASRNYYERKDELEMACELFLKNSEKMIEKL